MKSIGTLLRKPRRRIVGLMSGTSADGVDAALLDIETLGSGPDAGSLTWELIDFLTFPYEAAVREEVLAVQQSQDEVLPRLTRLHFVLGNLFSDAVESLCQDAGTPLDSVDVVASHGQTVSHFPRVHGGTSASTLQIGEPSVLAQRLGLPVISNFRSRDVVAGGTGAPLVPLVDYLLFADPDRSRIALNVGGIANMTAMRAGCNRNEVVAFDTGPGNMVMDAAISVLSKGERCVDEGGALARKGKPDQELLESLLADSYFKKAPPKAAGREQFGLAFTNAFLEKSAEAGLSDPAILSTATWFTAKSVWEAYRRFVQPGFEVQELIVSGGGAHNVALLEYLSQSFEGIRVVTSDYYGLDVDAKEAAAFALLGHLSLNGEAGNIPAVTGASEPVILGTLTPGDRLS